MQIITDWLNNFALHDLVLFHLGQTAFTLNQLLALLVGIVVLFVVSGLLNRFVINRLLSHTHVDLSTRYTIAALVRYSVLVIGFMAIMQTAGINLSAFSVLAGAVGVGVGFGLQNIVSNFISGLIVMFERPVKIGDRVDLGGIQGDVLKIGARATQILATDGSVVIMPNQKFITDPVKNWAAYEERSPLVMNINIDKTSDLRHVATLLESTVRKHPGVMPGPPTQVRLTGISGSAAFVILAWVDGGADKRKDMLKELYLQVAEALAQQQIKLA